MQRVEQKLADWKAIYDKAREAQGELLKAVETGDSAEIDRRGEELEKLNRQSDAALKALHDEIEAAKKA